MKQQQQRSAADSRTVRMGGVRCVRAWAAVCAVLCGVLFAGDLFGAEGVDHDSALAWIENQAPPHGRWDYGAYTGAAVWQSFVRLTDKMTYSSWIGGTAQRWSGEGTPSGYPAVSQYAMAPSHDQWAVRRWTSDVAGTVEIDYDTKRIQDGGSGQVVGICHNGVMLWSEALRNDNLHAMGSLTVTVAVGDVIDCIVDSEGGNSSDWTYYRVRLRVVHRRPVARDGLALHYAFDEEADESDTSASADFSRVLVCGDASGQNRHAGLGGMSAADHVLGRVGHGLAFDGGNDHAVTHDTDIAHGATALTLSAWIRPDARDRWDGVLTTKSVADNLFTGVALADYGVGFDSPTFRVMNEGNISSTIDTPVGTWSHVVCVWQSGVRHRIYVNGRLGAENDGAAHAGAIVMEEPWYVGSDRLIGGRWFDGLIDDVSIWTRALSEEEIGELYRLGIHGWDASYLGNPPQDAGHLPYAAGLNVWLDAQDIDGRANAALVDGDVILEWVNRAGGVAGNGVPGLGGTRIGLYGAGSGPMGMDTIRLDGSNLDSLRLDEFMSSSTFSLFAVAKNTGGNGTRPLFWDAHTNATLEEVRFGTTPGGVMVRDRDGDVLSVPFAEQLFLHGWDCGVMVLSEIRGSFMLEAGPLDRTSTATSASYDATTWEGVSCQPHVGKRPDATNMDSFGGEIAEILIYDHALLAGERALLRQYLLTKYFNMSDGLGITIR